MHTPNYKLLQAVVELTEALELLHPTIPEHVRIDLAISIARLEQQNYIVNLKTLEIERKLPSVEQEAVLNN